MSTLRTQQIANDSLDSLGISVVTSLKDSDRINSGSIYNSSSLAAGVLVHNHLMNDNTVLSLFGTHLIEATVYSASEYTDFTIVEDPVWVAYHPTTGVPVHGQWSRAQIVPTTQNYTSRSLRAACSRRNYLYALQRLDNKPYLQFFNLDQSANLLGEEFVPIIETEDEEIKFDNGCYISGNYLVLIGEGQSTHNVYLSRKEWSRIGVGKFAWEYSTDTGWSSDSDPTPEKTSMGPFTTSGTCSGWLYKDTTYITTVEESEGTWTGKILVKYSTRPWLSVGYVSLATPSTLDEVAYYGLRLQGHLKPNAVADEMTQIENSYALPLIESHQTSEVVGEVTLHTLSNQWSLLPISRRV